MLWCHTSCIFPFSSLNKPVATHLTCRFLQLTDDPLSRMAYWRAVSITAIPALSEHDWNTLAFRLGHNQRPYIHWHNHRFEYGGIIIRANIRAVPEIILKGGGAQTLFCPVEGGCFVDCVRGVGGGGWRGHLSWGSRHIWSIVGRVN